MSEETLLENGKGEDVSVRRMILVVVLMNLLATTAGGYLLVGRYEAALNHSTRSLTEVQLKLAQMELAQAEMKIHYEAENIRLTHNLDLARLLAEMSPSVQVRIKPDGVEMRGKRLAVVFEYRNTGAQPAVISIESFELYTVDGRSPVKLSNLKLNSGLKIPTGGSAWLGAEFDNTNIPERKYRYVLKYGAMLESLLEDHLSRILTVTEIEIDPADFRDSGTIEGIISW